MDSIERTLDTIPSGPFIDFLQGSPSLAIYHRRPRRISAHSIYVQGGASRPHASLGWRRAKGGAAGRLALNCDKTERRGVSFRAAATINHLPRVRLLRFTFARFSKRPLTWQWRRLRAPNSAAATSRRRPYLGRAAPLSRAPAELSPVLFVPPPADLINEHMQSQERRKVSSSARET